MKYMGIALVATLLSSLMAFIPLFYNVNLNYDLFIELAYLNSPNVVNNLESEKNWMNSIMIFSILGQILFIYIFMLKMTAKIVGPMKVLKNHLKILSRGFWNTPPIKIREDDEFQEVINTYNYFLQSFKEDLKKDVERMENIKIERSRINDYKNWQDFIYSRKQQLGLSVEPKVFAVSSDAATHDSRHAS